MTVVSEVRSLTIPLVILAIIYVVSIIFFHYAEGWEFLDAAYYTTVTLATVGYGDFTPQTGLGKIGAMVLIFTGVSTALYVITHLGLLREKTIDPHVQRRIEMLRNLTSLQTGNVRSEEVRKIKDKIRKIQEAHEGKGQGSGRL
ncbi:two pore domain potassium channel family protein [Candidatus Micrarchaeota archaeon]|nr:two pore domain potassium channel family protein [Candidatus Micrarchaeota archaeon]